MLGVLIQFVLNINNKSNIICFHCGKSGHKKFQCDKLKNNNGASSRWCNLCKNNTLDSKYCRKKNSIKHIDDTTTRQDDFAFKATHIDKCHNVMSSNDNLLVDCGATVHILNDESKFLNFEENFDSNNHVIELADGTRSSGIVKGRGTAQVNICDATGNMRTISLKKALCIPSYKQNIFSV